MLITINKSIEERSSLYDATRLSWIINRTNARKVDYVLAVNRGLIIAAFEPHEWFAATGDRLPPWAEDHPDRSGFVGTEAPAEIQERFVRHRVPDTYRTGSSNPIRYVNID